MMNIEYSVVIPVHNSAESLPILNKELTEVLNRSGKPYEIIYVDDCSPDESWNVLQKLKASTPNTRMLRLANNVGQFMAFHCGVSKSKGKHIITIDDDLEYETSDIAKLIEYYHKKDLAIVYGMPDGKSSKNLSYSLTFKIRNYLLNKILQKGKTDSFRIFNRKILFDENDNLLSGLHFEAYAKLMVSPKYTGHLAVSYQQRPYGKSGHNFFKKINILARYGLEYHTSPLTSLIYLGIATCFFCIGLILLYLLGSSMLSDRTLLILGGFLFGVFLIALGIIGYYLAQIFLLLKGKPNYVILEEL